jgi:hypothetical protein
VDRRANRGGAAWPDRLVGRLAYPAAALRGPPARALQRDRARSRARTLAWKLGLSLFPQARRVSPRWSEGAIEKTLRPLLRGRRAYPTRREFEAANLGPLYQAIATTAGGNRRGPER